LNMCFVELKELGYALKLTKALNISGRDEHTVSFSLISTSNTTSRS
jgi:hypothetical protein